MKSHFTLGFSLILCFACSQSFCKTTPAATTAKSAMGTVTTSKKIKKVVNIRAALTASEVVQKFYEQYMGFHKTSQNKAPELMFSKDFRSLIDKNDKMCKQHAKGDVCGFGADGDIYLDAQDFDKTLTFQNSKFRIFEAEPGLVDVYFDIEPSQNKPIGTNDKKIHFKMIKEKQKWVVDDIVYDKTSARENITTEMLLLEKN